MMQKTLFNPYCADFYRNDAVTVAKHLIGQLLIRQTEQQLMVSRIVETEAYVGGEDTACHASKGRTPRTEVMYRPGGVAYVYLIYGMYHMLNIVTGDSEHPQAVLIRGVEPLALSQPQTLNTLPIPAKSQRRSNGPGKLCRYLDIDKSLNGHDLILGEKLWVSPSVFEQNSAPKLIGDDSPLRIESGPRIGIDYAEPEDRARPWRFWVKDHPFVSVLNAKK